MTEYLFYWDPCAKKDHITPLDYYYYKEHIESTEGLTYIHL